MAKTIAAGVFMVNNKGEVLICHPTNHKPDFYSIPKGKVEEGEDLKVAAIRETYEETNINIPIYSVMHQLEMVDYSHKKKAIHPFVLFENENRHLVFEDFDLKCNSNVPEEKGGFPEMDGYRWVSFEDAKTYLHETQRACIDKIKTMFYEKNRLTWS
jgi:8-oxo-dGTP pyrophosphatase MutT (NUDIX family)